MQTNAELMRRKAAQLLAEGAAVRVLGWKPGEFVHDPSPSYFHDAGQLDSLVYDGFCAANLSKYLIKATEKPDAGKTAVFLKPCDTYSLNQLVTEHRVDREQVYALGVECDGMLDMEKIRAKGIRILQGVEETGGEVKLRHLGGEAVCPRSELLLEKCVSCKSKKHVVYDELVPESTDQAGQAGEDRFRDVERLEAMTPDERFAFWQGELSRCIRCNACRNACPACSCIQCVFDNAKSGVSSKASADDFEDSMFHIVRAFHVAGRCTDCGECSRVCPQNIPLHLLNRKIIKDINELFGEYQAGEEAGTRPPLVDYSAGDADPGEARMSGGVK